MRASSSTPTGWTTRKSRIRGRGKTSSVTPWDRLDEGNRPQNADLQFLYKDTDTDFEKHKDQSLVIQYQCYWREPYYRVLDPATNQLVSFDKAKYGKIRKAYKDATGQDLQAVKQMRRVYYRGFYCGRTELEYKKSPCQEGFTFKFITAKRDRNRKQWYGIVRAMMDPQRWANKWLSQILHIINTNAKGGAFVETNALKDPRKAEEQWASSNPLIELNEGGSTRSRSARRRKTPTGLDKLMTFAFESLPFVSASTSKRWGSPIASRLACSRRSAASPPTASWRRSSTRCACTEASGEDAAVLHPRVHLRWAADSRARPRRAAAIPAAHEKARDGRIRPDRRPVAALAGLPRKDVGGDEGILPVMMKEGIPIPPSLFDFAPLPANVAAEFKQMVMQRNQIPPQVQEQMQKMQEALQKAGEEVQSLRQQNSELKVGAQVDILKIHAQHAQAQDKNRSRSTRRRCRRRSSARTPCSRRLRRTDDRAPRPQVGRDEARHADHRRLQAVS
jgi:hypothetical protein